MARLIFPCVLSLGLTTACFSPDRTSPGDTDPGDTDPSTSGATMSTTTDPDGSSSDPTPGTTIGMTDSGSTTLVEESSSSSTGEPAPPGWGEGEPPDFGDLGPDGDATLLLVHALDVDEPVDVWLVGDTQPIAADLDRADAIRIEGIPRDARRVVFARAGTTEAVGCSDWFPLRADEQWAVVASREEHSCPSPSADGATLSFEQSQVLDSNPVRYVHAAAPEDFDIARSGVPEPGGLAPLETATGSELPDCSASGCSVSFNISVAGGTPLQEFTFAVSEASQIPPPGEMLFVAIGDIREDWPTEPDALQLLVVDIEGGVRPLLRDPGLAVAAPGEFGLVEFSILGSPVIIPFAESSDCGQQACIMQAVSFAPGEYTFRGTTSDNSVNGDFTLEAGRRYVLAYRSEGLMLVEDAFSRADSQVAVARGVNFSDKAMLTIGRVFGGDGQAFEELSNIPPSQVSDEQVEVPTGGWDMVTAVDSNPLGSDCFHPVDTPAAWRGFLNTVAIFDLTQWPPLDVRVPTLCF